MEDDLRVLKRCLAAGAERRGVKFTELIRTRGINDFFIDESTTYRDSGPRERAARALSSLCDDVRGTMDQAIIIGVIEFLDRVCGTSLADKNGTMRITSLAGLVHDLASFHESQRIQHFLRWAEGWYS